MIFLVVQFGDGAVGGWNRGRGKEREKEREREREVGKRA